MKTSQWIIILFLVAIMSIGITDVVLTVHYKNVVDQALEESAKNLTRISLVKQQCMDEIKKLNHSQ